MFAEKLHYGYTLGYTVLMEENNQQINPKIVGNDLFPEILRPSTTIKSIKIWFGALKGDPNTKTILGISATYINYITGEKKETSYQGAPIEGSDVETKELIIKEGDYLSKFNIGFKTYINHIKFTTLKGESIEFGEINEETEKRSVNELNKENNIIINIKGDYDNQAVRAIGYDFLSFKDFCLVRLIDLFRIRNKLKDDKYKTEIQNKYNKMNEIEKYFFKICSLPQGIFSIIAKYI